MPLRNPTAEANLNEALRDITAEVLETMFYLFPDEEPEEKEPQTGCSITAAFRFSGTPSGVVAVAISAAAARTAAANFLAIDEDEADTQKTAEVVCEMANMVGGCLLGCIENRTPLQPFPPEVVAEESFADRQATANHVFYLENGRLQVSLYWE